MNITSRPFGVTHQGVPVTLFRLENPSGAYIEVLEYGATLRTVCVPDKNGLLTDVCLGYDTLAEYEDQNGCLGMVVGRCANRIKGASFVLNDKEYHLTANKGKNHLHGGQYGFNRKVWSGRIDGDSLLFTLFSPDGEEHYPGNLTVQVRYTWTEDNQVILEYQAKTDADTIVNLTNHAYWNLSGHGAGSVGRHTLQVHGDAFTEMDEESCPSGVIAPVEGTPFDLRLPEHLADGWDAGCPQIKVGDGYDHNWALNGAGYRKVAALASGESQITLTVWTDQPGMQVYTANGLTDRPGKGGARYGRRCSVALETQAFPDAVHHENFPSVVLRAGEVYRTKTAFAFS